MTSECRSGSSRTEPSEKKAFLTPHGKAGAHRAGTVAVSTLMNLRRLNPDEAISMTKRARNIVDVQGALWVAPAASQALSAYGVYADISDWELCVFAEATEASRASANVVVALLPGHAGALGPAAGTQQGPGQDATVGQ